MSDTTRDDFDFGKLMEEIYLDIVKDDQKARENMPEMIKIHKKMFLTAIKEIPDEKLSDEDLQSIESFTASMFLPFLFTLWTPKSLVWDDTKAKEKVDEVLKKHAQFDLSKYLECAKIVFLAYSGSEQNAVNAMEYVLTHARQFGDTTKSIFQIDESDNLQEAAKYDREQLVLQTLPTNKLLDKISQITQDLTTTYDETKYTILNVNATYFTLLMLRRIVKNETEFVNAFKKIQTHDNYVKLCPSPLDKQLPKCEFKICEKSLLNCAYLAIEAYLNTADEKTKRVLRATSLLYMEWNGLQLPELFFKVVKLFKVTAEELYDLLFVCDSDYQVLASCFYFADDYYNIHEKLKTGVTNRWFPYCRVLDGAYHVNLSAKDNVDVCVTLAYLVDLKMGFDRSTVRMSHWVKSHNREKGMETAKALYEKLNKHV